MFEKTIEYLSRNLIESTRALIRIPSVSGETDNPSLPFGENVNHALEYVLDLGRKMGFRTKNIDGYCGYIEFGEGEDMLGIIGHLDVVPEGEGWTHPPFSATIENGKIYGRGAIDDKGPVMASLYAMKAVAENCNVHKRVRLILGLNEERGWKCIEYYKKHEELPTIGFSPDSDFPCIYAEKGIASCYFSIPYTPTQDDKIRIESIDCNNNAINVVPKFCKVVLKINPHKASIFDLKVFTENFIYENNFDIDIVQEDETTVVIKSYGVQSHAAHPELGDNALSKMIVLLNHIFKKFDCNLELLDFFSKYIGFKYTGEDIELNFEDESGILTINTGDFSLEDDVLQLGLNLRIPVHTDYSLVEYTFKKYLDDYPNIKFKTARYQEPLYISKDNYLVKTLCRIYNEEAHSNLEPATIGGGTYARAFDNCVCFGPNFPGHKDMCHQTDEFVEIENLILTCKIYARAIYELSQ